jgi:hypothetical protein
VERYGENFCSNWGSNAGPPRPVATTLCRPLRIQTTEIILLLACGPSHRSKKEKYPTFPPAAYSEGGPGVA